MRKALLAAASMALMAGGTIGVVNSPGIAHQTEVRATPAQAPAPAQAVQQKSAIREQRSIGDAVRAMRIPTARKTRAGGERANRRWRKRRAAGRA